MEGAEFRSQPPTANNTTQPPLPPKAMEGTMGFLMGLPMGPPTEVKWPCHTTKARATHSHRNTQNTSNMKKIWANLKVGTIYVYNIFTTLARKRKSSRLLFDLQGHCELARFEKLKFSLTDSKFPFYRDTYRSVPSK